MSLLHKSGDRPARLRAELEGEGGQFWAVWGDVERFRITGLGEVFSDVTGRGTADWGLVVRDGAFERADDWNEGGLDLLSWRKVALTAPIGFRRNDDWRVN